MYRNARIWCFDPNLFCPEHIHKIMNLNGQHLNYLHVELEKLGVPKIFINSFFKFIVSFTVINYQYYPGTPAQRTTALLNALKLQCPWVFFMLTALGVPSEKANEIVRVVIAFTLANLLPVPLPPDEIPLEELPPEEIPPEDIPQEADLEQQVLNIFTIIEEETNILPTLEDLGVPDSRASEIVNTVILFTLRNINLTLPPTNTEQTATDLYEQLRLTNPSLIRELINYGVPNDQVRTILREIIFITLNNFTPITEQSDQIHQEVLRITDLIMEETNIYTDLENFGVSRNRIIEIIQTVVLFTLRSININQLPTSLEAETERILRNLRNSDPELIANMRAYRIPQIQINAILRGIIIYTLEAVS